jgi:hypothetical protein
MSTDKHLLRTETSYFPITFGATQQDIDRRTGRDKTKESDSLYIQKNVKDAEWQIIFDVNVEGKVSIIGTKIIGKLAGSASATDNEAKIKVILETTEKRSPLLKVVGYSTFDPKFVEVDDGKDRVTQTFKKDDETYKSQYPASSVLTPNEYFSEIAPEFEEFLKDPKLAEFVSKITESAAKVQKPYNRNYRLVK